MQMTAGFDDNVRHGGGVATGSTTWRHEIILIARVRAKRCRRDLEEMQMMVRDESAARLNATRRWWRRDRALQDEIGA
jgi:hypothetical protein